MTTTTPTLATLRATLAAAERRLASARDTADADAGALSEAERRLVDAHDAWFVAADLVVSASDVRPSACVGGGWDVDIALVDVEGGVAARGAVTLVVGDDARPAIWGSLDQWAGAGLVRVLYGRSGLIWTVEAVAREAIEASDVPRSPECEG